jgi:hypothetical protein
MFKVKSVHSEISAWVSFKSEGDKWENLFWIKLGGGPTLSTGLIKLSTIPGFIFLSRLKLLFALSEKEEHCNVLISMLEGPSVMSVCLSVLL